MEDGDEYLEDVTLQCDGEAHEENTQPQEERTQPQEERTQPQEESMHPSTGEAQNEETVTKKANSRSN